MRCAGQPVRREAVIARDWVTGGGVMRDVMEERVSSIPGITGVVLPGDITIIMEVMVVAGGSGVVTREVVTREVVVIVAAEEMVVAGEVVTDLVFV